MSDKLNSVEELDTYLKSNVGKLENKPILLEQSSGFYKNNTPGSYPGHVVVLKFKMVKDNPEPVKMLFDYQYQGFFTTRYTQSLSFSAVHRYKHLQIFLCI